MATAAAGSRKGGRGRKALTAVLDNDANISAGKADVAAGILSPPQKAKRATSKSKGKAAAAAAEEQPSVVDAVSELQGMLEKLRLEKEKAEEMVRERDEVIRKKEEEQDRLQAELKKVQRAKEFKPTVSIPLVKSLIEKDQEGEKKKGKGKAGHERKKPCPAYVLWCKDQWNEIKKESPEADFKEVSNALGAKWKALGAEEKQPYEERYKQEKEAYLQVVGQEKREAEAMKLLEEEQMQRTAKELLDQYLKFRQEAEDDGDKKARKKGKKKEKDPSKPKQPMSAYFVYTQQRRAALVAEKKNVPEIGKITGEEWKAMTEAEKAPFEEIARKQRKEYQVEMAAYRQRKQEEAASQEKEEEEQKKIMKQEALQLLKKKEKTENIIKKTKEQRKKKVDGAAAAAADPNRPKKPASSFLLFSKEARRQLAEERPGVASSTLTALVSVKWKELGEAEKQAWNGKAAEAMAAYKRDMEDYTKAAHAEAASGGGAASPCASSSASS
uniref:HMG box domain-containing protein n=1 Tax=Oryza punctata TaxID=4537 RepID=A0A0E0JY43_ORYPU